MGKAGSRSKVKYDHGQASAGNFLGSFTPESPAPGKAVISVGSNEFNAVCPRYSRRTTPGTVIPRHILQLSAETCETYKNKKKYSNAFLVLPVFHGKSPTYFPPSASCPNEQTDGVLILPGKLVLDSPGTGLFEARGIHPKVLDTPKMRV